MNNSTKKPPRPRERRGLRPRRVNHADPDKLLAALIGPETNLPLVLAPKQVGAALGISTRTLEGWRARGTGPCWFRLGHGARPQIRYCTPCMLGLLRRRSPPRPGACSPTAARTKGYKGPGRPRPPGPRRPRQPRDRQPRRRPHQLALAFGDLASRYHWDYFIGLSCNRDRVSEAWLEKAVRRFADRIADMTRAHVRFTWVLELQQRGTLHAHLLLALRPDWQGKPSVIARRWTHGTRDVQPYDPAAGGDTYIAKELGAAEWGPPALSCPQACRDAGNCVADLAHPWASP